MQKGYITKKNTGKKQDSAVFEMLNNQYYTQAEVTVSFWYRDDQHFQKATLLHYSLCAPNSLYSRLYVNRHYYDLHWFLSFVKVEVKLSLCLTKHHAMKAYWGSGGIAPRIL
jgi:hypothetical protein